MARPKKKGLNINEKKFVKHLAEGHTQVDAYQMAYPRAKSRTAAKGRSSTKIQEPKIKDYLQKVLRDNGIDEQGIAETLLQLKRSKNWRAKDAFINHSKEMLGYKNTPQQQLNFQQNIYGKREEYDI